MSRALRGWGILTSPLVYRSLRFQLIAIVVVTVATVLVTLQWLDTGLSERALERDLHERALLTLVTLDSLWERSESAVFGDTLEAIVDEDREITAIDIFRLRDGLPQMALTTRKDEGSRPIFNGDQLRQLLANTSVTSFIGDHGPPGLMRVAVPLSSKGVVTGVAQADLSLAEAARLKGRLRLIHGVFLALSVTAISLALALFLERRVARPVTELVAGMRQAEEGSLDVRLPADRGGEFGFLARNFNRMVAHIEDLTAGLESRVRQATSDLAERNRELRNANEELWHAQLEIGRSERLATLGQMAATIAHELGTPLNSVLGYTQLLQRETIPPEQAAKLSVIESQVQRMIETIRSVLDRTRDRDLRREPVSLGPLVEDALALVSTRLSARDLTARSEVGGDLPSIPGDAIALRQVVLNLLTNAIDATEGPGRIDVSARMVVPNGRPGHYLELAVQDSGHGMTAEQQRRVFEPFYTTKAPGRGTGLGLAIVEHIVRAHGGRVVVDSSPGEGTTMRVWLPVEA